MSVRQILESRTIVCSVPDERKAAAVEAAVEGPVSPDVPASILQNARELHAGAGRGPRRRGCVPSTNP